MKKIKLILISLLTVFGTLYATNDCGNPTALTMNTDDCSPTNHNIGTATATTIAEPCGVATHDDWFFEFTTNASQEVAVIRVGNFLGTNQFGGGTTQLFGELSIYTSCSSSPLYCVNLSEWTTHTIPELLPGTSYLIRISYFDNSIIVSEEIDICVIQPALGEICESPFPLLPEEGACTLETFNLEDISTLNSDLPVSCGSVDYHDVYFEFTANSEEVNIQTGDFFEIIEAAYIAVYNECSDEVFCSTLSENNIYFAENLIVGSNYQIRALFASGGAPTMEICVYEPCVFYTWFADTDSDNFGDVSNSVIECYQPMGYVADSTDCDDTNPNINPGAPEICNDLDDDCDGLIDDIDPDVAGTTRWFADNDEDGYGDPMFFIDACRAPGDNWVEDNTDCDDNNPDVFPGADEFCDGTDNNCDGLIDDDDPAVIGQDTWFADFDNDNYGDPAISVLACDQPTGYISDDTDCDDTDPDSYPGAEEICDGIDNDCDGLDDDDDPDAVGQVRWFIDNDEDGYGIQGFYVVACAPPGDNYSIDSTDCDDTNPNINPGAPDICNGIDDNCNGEVDENSIVEVLIGVNGLSLLANVAGGTPPFSYYWSTGETTISITLPEPEDTWLWVTDAYGCIDSALHVFTSINTVEDLVIRIYPIPAINTLQLDFPQDIHQLDLVEIINITGKRIFSEKNVNSSTVGRIDLSGEDPGYYTLYLINDGKSQILKFIIMRE